ncbi:ubiquinol oxidase subunit II [Hyphomicrobium sp.]|uniref:ubiquinol oxidase subunit II n=1 Tax=Hyphomicrobium sp. TaxID=82 RepID=UPI0025B8B656|nr:ubiquinol oxidase subunit II [Hyphomicrobium sp.]MCC7254010.1 ubiquinol oxidase subunit II [Hyphomicrobium sp.]
MSRFRLLALAPLTLMLGGCDFVVLNPAGDIAVQQRDLVVISTVLMLLIIVPVMALTVFFAWKYREANEPADYDPDWNHSTYLELVIWAAPLLIIICLGAVTWMWTHLLDPYRSLDRVTHEQPVAAEVKPLEVEVVALDWKWLFIYPEHGIATVNEMAAPVDRPIRFRLTATSVMNAFYVPALAGMIYAMPGMETTLHGVINKSGTYTGFSANYSGDGFSGMRFAFHGLDEGGFEKWLAAVRVEGGALDRATYLELAKPSENEPVRRYATVEPQLFRLIRDRCAEPGKMCMDEMMAIDASGGLGLAGINLLQPPDDKGAAARSALFGPKATAVTGICTTEEAMAARQTTSAPRPADRQPLLGAGLPRPPFTSFTSPKIDASLLRSLSGT